MKTSEIIQIAREEFLDDVPDIEDQDDSSAAADTTRLIRWVGEAERQACRHGDCKRIYDEGTAAICTLTLATGTQSYALDSRILLFDALPIYSGTGEVLAQTTRAVLDRDYAGWRDYDAGEPQRFHIKGRTLYLDRAPSADEDTDTLTLYVWREPLKAPKQHESPEIDAAHHWHLAHWLAYRYFSMPNAATKDDDRAMMHRREFIGYFGPPVKGDVLEHQLENPDWVRHDAGRGYANTWHSAEIETVDETEW